MTVVIGFTTHCTKPELRVFIRKFLKRKSEKFPQITFVHMVVSDQDRNTLNILKGSLEEYPKIFHIREGNKILISSNAITKETINDSFEHIENLYEGELKNYQKYAQNKNNKTNKTKPIVTGSDNDGSVDDLDNPSNGIDCGADGGSNHGADGGSNQGIDSKSDLAIDNPQKSLSSNQELDPDLEKKKTLEKLVFLNKKSDDLKLNMVKEIAKRKRMENAIAKKKLAEENADSGKEYRKSLRKTGK